MNADEIVRALRETQDLCLICSAKLLCADGLYCKTRYMLLAADLIESLKAENVELRGINSKYLIRVCDLDEQLAASKRREQAAVEMLIKFIKQSDDACDYCKNLIECKGEGCECFEQGKGGTSDGKEYPDFKWTCEDFDHGTCRMMKNTPCNGCFENDCSGFEWRGPQAGKGAAPNE